MLESKTIFGEILEGKEKMLRLHRNRLLELAQVGDKPFDKEFYQTAQLPHAIDKATHMVINMSGHIGDAALSLPVITSLAEYFKINALEGKKMTMISPHRDLFTSLRTIYPELNLLETVESFDIDSEDKLFLFNLNRKFHDCTVLGMETTAEQDPMKVFRHDCQDWMKEEIPIQPGVIKKYDLLPLRIMRNMEILFGQKLYEDIYSVKEFIPKENGFDDQKEKITIKFGLDRNKLLMTISPGASAKGKEYKPECWAALITMICERKPDIQIFFMDDTDEKKRASYADMVNRLKEEKSYDIHRGGVALSEMNTLMHMSRLSVTPDTGLGHYSSMCGIPNVMFSLSNSIFWSGPNTIRITHPYGKTMMHNNALVDLHFKDNEDSFYYGESENKRGASDIAPELVADRILKLLQ